MPLYKDSGRIYKYDEKLRQVVYEELESVESSFQAAQRTMNQIQAQIKEVRVKLDSTAGGTRVDWSSTLSTWIEEQADIEGLRKEVRNLKYKIPYSLIYPSPPSVFSVNDPNVVWHPRTSTTARTRFRDDTYKLFRVTSFQDVDRKLAEECNPNFYFLQHPDAPATEPLHQALLEFIDSLDERSTRLMECLKQFPMGVFIKRTLLLNFFRAHSSESESSSSSDDFDYAINNFLSKGFLRTICKRSTSTVSSYWMESPLRQAYSRFRGPFYLSPLPSEECEILYSDNRPIIQKMKDVQVLLLGKWHRSLPLSQHIEVADRDLFYKGMEKLTEVKYISLRGISMIPEIPQFITKLKKLGILDCKACHNLEVIPDNINKLSGTLTQLDMSECHLLNHMPASLSDLIHLQVLKGFHLGEPNQHRKSCTLRDLTKLSKLQKLHICTSVKGFPTTNHLIDLQKLQSLRNLGISWRGCQKHEESTKAERVLTHMDSVGGGGGDQQQFSFNLEKLDLQCVPNTVTRVSLNHLVFKGLKKLYITGGKFFDLGQKLDDPMEDHASIITKENHWTVEVLRLKHLKELKMDKSELENLFPKLINLEKVDCPNLTSCCNNNGIWLKSSHPHLKQVCLEKDNSPYRSSACWDGNGIWLKYGHPPPINYVLSDSIQNYKLCIGKWSDL